MSVPQAQVFVRGPVYANTPAEVWAHLQRRDASFNLVDVVRSDLSTITYKVTQGATVIIASTAIVIATAIFDTLQPGTAWTEDSAGLNFAFTLPAAAFPTGGLVYEAEFVFTLAGGQTFPVLVQMTALALP